MRKCLVALGTSQPSGLASHPDPTRRVYAFMIGIVLFASLGLGCSSGSSGEPGDTTTPPPTLERLIEEGDIVWLDGTILYVLNATNGLSVVSLADVNAPLLLGRVRLQGTPVELYLHNGHILALTSSVYSSSSSTAGSLLSVVDVRKPETPILKATVVLEGQTTNSRIVGDILYTASDSGKVIQSVNVAEPSQPRVVDRLPLPLGAYGSHVLATQNVFYVATESWAGSAMGECAASSYDADGCTTIIAVDISSTTGLLRRGASYAMAGLLKDRWGLDYYDGVLRVLIARGGWWTSKGHLSATLRTFLATNANEMEPLGWLSLATERYENVMAVRFDGPCAYVVTFLKTDPLFTIDISNPAVPRVAGYLKTPGYLDFIIPRGNRMLGIGREDSLVGAWRLHASLYDVSQLANPTLLSRTYFGDSYTTLPDQSDNLAKVVRVIDSLGVLLVPYNGSSVGYGSSTNDGHLEVISFANNTLTSLGKIKSIQPILRAIPLPPVHVAAVTESAVGIIQITPDLTVIGSVDLNQTLPQTSNNPVDASPKDASPKDASPKDASPPVDSSPVDTSRIEDSPVGDKPIDNKPIDSSPMDGGSHD
jgi:hypothetical protein